VSYQYSMITNWY